jgi:subtilisin family serine protease
MHLRGVGVCFFLISFLSLGLSLSLEKPLFAADHLHTPDDPYYIYQSAISQNGPRRSYEESVAHAWELVTDASSVIVAVIDTGADLSHPDLEQNLWINSDEIPDNGIDDDGDGYVDDFNGYDFRNHDGIPEDERGHGTITAGIIGASGNNGLGTAGVAWSSQLMILKVFGATGGGRVQDFADAIHYAVRHGAKVINASWIVSGSYPGDQIPVLEAAVREANEAGVLVVAAAGNDSINLDETPVFPAGYSFGNVVAVAALKADEEELLDNSNYGEKTVAVATIGEEVIGPYLAHGYALLTGTSSAAALVSGVAALIFSERSDLPPSQVRDILIQASDVSSALQGKVASGGILNPYSSLTASIGAAAEQGQTASAGGGQSGSSNLASMGGCSLLPSE